MLVITGWGSEIAAALCRLLPAGEAAASSIQAIDTSASRYLFCHGLLRSKRIEDQTRDEIADSFWVNYASTVIACREIFAANPRARICIVGSESGYRGSYDDVYAAAKAALHLFVETERLGPHQQLVAVSPGIVGDAGMTTRRTDIANLERRRRTHPKQRFITSAEVASMIYSLLYVDSGFVSGTVVRLHGGAA